MDKQQLNETLMKKVTNIYGKMKFLGFHKRPVDVNI